MERREEYTELQTKILAARSVWKRSLFWTGIAIVLIGLLAILVGGSIVDWLMPLPSAVRIAFLAGIVGTTFYLLYRYLVVPIRAALSLLDVALNVEQSHPDLEDRLVSAVQFGSRETKDPIEAHMLQRLLADTVERIKGIDFKATIDHSRTRKYVGLAALVIAACGLLTLLFPTETQTSLMRLLVPWEKTDPIMTTKVEVTPGDARILRGKSLPIQVTVTGKDADKVVLTYYDKDNPPTAENEGSKQEINMLQNPDDKRGFAYEIFNIEKEMTYYVVANETTSESFTVEVFEMPRVEDVSVSYTYPEYTDLSPVVQQGSGDIKAVVGTSAEIRFTTNKAIQKATFTMHNKKDAATTEDVGENNTASTNSSEMTIADGNTLTKTIEVLENGKYTVDLFCIDEFHNEIPIEYSIKAIPDKPPKVVVKEPGRDVKATKLEEVQIVAEATDDFGVEELNLKYRIGAGELKEVALEATGEFATESTNSQSGKKVRNGTYTFYLEEFDIEPGQVISYYAHAVDNNILTGPSEARSDIYFIEVKPFNRRYEDQEAMEMDMEGMPNPMPGLIALQKQVIRETWTHVNNQPKIATEEFASDVKKTSGKQGEVKDKTQEVVDNFSMQMQETQIPPEIMMNLEEAVDKMGEAMDELNATKPMDAIPPEQAALELLIKVDLEMPKVLMQARSNQPQMAENLEMELEDLQNELEQNQEELDEQLQEQTQQMLDQAREMLEQQQNLNEQSQEMGKQDQPSPSDMQQNSQQQGQLSQQAQQMSQQLGQMQGNAQDPQQQRLAQAGQSMQQASEQMQQASQGMQQQQPQMSAAKGEKAEERLEEAIEQLEKAASEFTDNALERAAQQLQQMTEQQSEVQQQTQELRDRSQQQGGMNQEDYRQASELANQQRQLQRDLESLEENLDNLQEQLNQENPEAADNVADASERLSQEQTAEDMATAQRALQWRSLQSADLNQQEVVETLEQAQADLQQARANMAQTEEEQLEAALEQLETFEEQMQDMQREQEGMEGQEQSEDQQQREQQLAERNQQLAERMQEAQEAMQNAQEGQQPGQEGQTENDTDIARGGVESYREIEELWLEMLDSMQPPSRNRSRPLPNYELSIRALQKLESALEERLNMLQEKKRLTQVAKEDVPPEYRKLVDNYYESLAK